MLLITIPETEMWDDSKQEFVYYKQQTLQLEHSLISLSKWESKYHKPFLTDKGKTYEETLFYIKCMTLTQNVNPDVYTRLTKANMQQINEYISNPMTATRFSEEKKGRLNGEQVTAELVYYWMIALGIPVEFQKWHLNRLMTLIKVCSIKNQPSKKRSTREVMSQNARLNAERRKQLNSKG